MGHSLFAAARYANSAFTVRGDLVVASLPTIFEAKGVERIEYDLAVVRTVQVGAGAPTEYISNPETRRLWPSTVDLALFRAAEYHWHLGVIGREGRLPEWVDNFHTCSISRAGEFDPDSWHDSWAATLSPGRGSYVKERLPDELPLTLPDSVLPGLQFAFFQELQWGAGKWWVPFERPISKWLLELQEDVVVSSAAKEAYRLLTEPM